MKIDCAHDSLVDVDKLLLIQNPKNNNKHSKEQIERLAKIIDFQGQRHPIVVSNRSGFITKGHGRLMAIQKLGWTQAAVDYQDYISEAQEYADMTADNEIARWAEFDTEKFLTDIKDIDLGDIELLGLKEIPDLLKQENEGLTDPDDVPDVAENIHNVKLGQIWKLGDHRLMCGDSTDLAAVEKLMNGEKADMVFTDPPYGIKEEGDRSKRGGLAKGNNLKSFVDDSINYAIDAFNICQSLNINIQIWFGANYYCHHVPQSNNWLVWDKRVEDQNIDTNSDCELAWVKDGHQSVRIFRHLWKGMIKGSEHSEKRVHPTQKPIALSEWCFNKYGDPKSVLDLFGGSGSTLIACEKTNRKCYMMELDPHYCSVIIERWQQFTGKKAELING